MKLRYLSTLLAMTLAPAPLPAANECELANFDSEVFNPGGFESMVKGEPGIEVCPVFTVGEDIGGYFPPGILDGLGAFRLDEDKVRILANHELLNFRGYDYDVSDGSGGTFSMDGARISYFDIDTDTLAIIDAGLALSLIHISEPTRRTIPSRMPSSA